MLEKIRSTVKVAKASREGSTVQKNLIKVKEINKQLRVLLDDESTAVRPGPGRRQLSRQQFLHRNPREPEEVYKAICVSYACSCDEPHEARFACSCPSCHSPFCDDLTSPSVTEWTFQLIFAPRRDSAPGEEASTGVVDIHENNL